LITTIAWANNLLKCFPPAIVALDLLTHPMLGAILLMFGSILTVSWYGWLHLLAFFPIWFLFGFFWGVAPLIGMFKIVNAFTPIQFVATEC